LGDLEFSHSKSKKGVTKGAKCGKVKVFNQEESHVKAVSPEQDHQPFSGSVAGTARLSQSQ